MTENKMRWLGHALIAGLVLLILGVLGGASYIVVHEVKQRETKRAADALKKPAPAQPGNTAGWKVPGKPANVGPQAQRTPPQGPCYYFGSFNKTTGRCEAKLQLNGFTDLKCGPLSPDALNRTLPCSYRPGAYQPAGKAKP